MRYSLQGVIEVDDTYIGGKRKPGKRGRGAGGKVPVMLAVESRPKGCGHVALSKMESFSSLHADSFLHQKLRDDVFITTDGLPLYRPLAASFHVCQIPLNGGPKAVELFPHVHRVIARLKTWLRGTHCHVSKKHLNRYLHEFSYRFNRRFKHRRATIFDRLLNACCNTQAITYRHLIADLRG